MTSPVHMETNRLGVTTLTLDRSERRNALDNELVLALTEALQTAAHDDATRAVVVTGAGEAFCAGMDLHEARTLSSGDPPANRANAQRLTRLFETLDALPIPTVARVNGPAFGGGVGLVACCDIAVAVRGTQFGLSEIRLGLIPSVTAPYLVRALGTRQLRRWALSGASFKADEALRLGLVHIVVGEEDLDLTVAQQGKDLLAGGPEAVKACKRLLAEASAPAEERALALATVREGDEAREGIAAFLEKRAPKWLANGNRDQWR